MFVISHSFASKAFTVSIKQGNYASTIAQSIAGMVIKMWDINQLCHLLNIISFFHLLNLSGQNKEPKWRQFNSAVNKKSLKRFCLTMMYPCRLQYDKFCVSQKFVPLCIYEPRVCDTMVSMAKAHRYHIVNIKSVILTILLCR